MSTNRINNRLSLLSSSVVIVMVIAMFSLCFTLVNGQQTKPDGSKLKLFTSYHTASLGAGALLYKQFTSGVYLTYEAECSTRPCDVLLIKSTEEFYQWRSNYYNDTFAVPGHINFAASYVAKENYPTTTNVVLVIANPKNASSKSDIWYNYKTADIPGANGGMIAAIVVGSLGALCLCLCCIGILLWLCRLRANPKDYIPQQDLPREF